MRLIDIIGEKRITALAFMLALFFVWVLHGTLPFLALPTLGQAVWTTGFSQSFINDSIFSIYARNIGAPEPAAIAFGLSGAWPAAIFIQLGFHPADAYSLMAALWLSVAFLSAYSVGRYFSVKPMLSILGAVLWMSMPVIWGHSGYSMVSFGMALLPFYFLAVLHLFMPKDIVNLPAKPEIVKQIAAYLAVCLTSVFMDGYSFMMFAAGSSLLGVWLFISDAKSRKRLLWFSLPVHCLSFGFSYFVYAIYIGKAQFDAAPIDFFRYFGVDVTFLLIPTQGVHWFADFIGWSVPRSANVFFGDASVWVTSFSIPIIVGAFWAAFNISRRTITIGLVIVAVFGFYMALGPSLKVNSAKPAGENMGLIMPAEYAVAPTGSAIISENVPGFKNMRASYRWIALGVFGAWALLVLSMSQGNKRAVVVGGIVLASMIVILNLPNLPQKLKKDINHRKMFLTLESDLIEGMKELFSPHEKVAFLPWRNDFLVNYAASRLNVITYNIGGDKNFTAARLHWPETMLQFPIARVDDDFAYRTLLLLARGEVDAVILPYIDMLWAAHKWPYPVELRDELVPVFSSLRETGFVDLVEREFYATVRLKPQFAIMSKNELEQLVGRVVCKSPQCLKRNKFTASTPSRVGVSQDGKLVSTGTAGFIHFGPYVPMEAGQYRLSVKGTATAVNSAFVDVVSGKGKDKHAKFLINPVDNEGGIIADGEVILHETVQDLEVRVYVGDEDEVMLESYELVPVSIR